jgi:antirestriction protein ArdC
MNTKVDYQALLSQAVNEPGKIMEAYRAFHNYSTGNQLIALFECYARGIQPGPLATFKAWQAKGRHVKRGEKAIALYMPITGKKETTNRETGQAETESFAFFRLIPRWFVLSQTEGEESAVEPITEWSKAAALEALGIEEVPFDMMNGNVQGYARENSIAVSPVAQLPHKTTFHELAHVVLGHTKAEGGTAADDETLPRNLMEVEAESVALLCLASLGLPGTEYCRGYIQKWLNSEEIPEKSARKIIHAADKILKAGTKAKS